MKTVERTQPLPARARAEDNSMTNRERFLRACRCAPVDRPPVWLMRQAGRALPEYRELKTRHSFLQLVQTPELAAEVTVQPIRRFDFDAAILFCDILAVAEGLGQSYSFQEQRGIEMAFLVKTSADIDRLDETAVTHRLEYVREAIRQTKARLRERTALIGFSGSPWTLANFMMEGGGVRDYTAARRLFYSDAARFSRFFEKLTTAISSYLHMQIDAGVEAIQIFDSLGGLLSPRDFAELSGRWMNEVVRSLNRRVPVIVFSKGTH
ncbi:MAG TPA: uroporphyrinogen decarboxylase family protein, partial [Verrucomicrobiae bacterium]|nr:uroporphyrinogen decarboxylase family protein [Verrucomicrobiae bacterium]